MCRGTSNLEKITRNFKVTFNFEAELPLVVANLQVIKGKIMMEEGQVETIPTCSALTDSATVHELLECYKVTEEYQEEKDPRNVQVPETKGEHDIVGIELESNTYAKPLRVCKLNIDMKEKPKFGNIGDYWNDETVEKIADILCEYQDLFTKTFSKIKGIAGELGKMNIPLKLYDNLVR
jgi:hypothetical protein